MGNGFYHDIRTGLFDSHNKMPGIAVTQERTVKTYEIELLVSDGGTSFLNGQACPIKKGNFLIAKPGDSRYSVLPFQCYFIHLPEMHADMLYYIEQMPGIFRINDRKKYIKLFEEISHYNYSSEPGSALMMNSKIYELLHCAYSDYLLTKNTPQDKSLRRALQDAKEYIEKNYSDTVTLEDIARHCHLSPIYLHKIFKEAFGISPHDYLMNKRLDTAKNLLLASNYSMVEIALMCGFTSQSYFSYVFKKHIGDTPNRFKARLKYIK